MFDTLAWRNAGKLELGRDILVNHTSPKVELRGICVNERRWGGSAENRKFGVQVA